MTTVSVTVITLNESAHIDACLASVAWADEVIVVDSGSTDDTVARAQARGARVIVRPWPGYAAQKNWAAEQASSDWILSIDADERVTPQLAAEIRAGPQRTRGLRLPHPTPHVAPRTVDPDDGLVSGLSAAALRSPPRPLGAAPRARIGDRRRARGDSSRRTCSTSRTGTSATTTRRWIATRRSRPTRCSTRVDRRASSTWSLHPPAAFLRNYVLRRGCLDGAVGFIISVMNAYYVFLKFAKLRALVIADKAPRRA